MSMQPQNDALGSKEDPESLDRRMRDLLGLTAPDNSLGSEFFNSLQTSRNSHFIDSETSGLLSRRLRSLVPILDLATELGYFARIDPNCSHAELGAHWKVCLRPGLAPQALHVEVEFTSRKINSGNLNKMRLAVFQGEKYLSSKTRNAGLDTFNLVQNSFAGIRDLSHEKENVRVGEKRIEFLGLPTTYEKPPKGSKVKKNSTLPPAPAKMLAKVSYNLKSMIVPQWEVSTAQDLQLIEHYLTSIAKTVDLVSNTSFEQAKRTAGLVQLFNQSEFEKLF